MSYDDKVKSNLNNAFSFVMSVVPKQDDAAVKAREDGLKKELKLPEK